MFLVCVYHMADHLVLDHQVRGSLLGMVNTSTLDKCQVPVAVHLGWSPHEIPSSVLTYLLVFSLLRSSLGSYIEIPWVHLSLSHTEHTWQAYQFLGYYSLSTPPL